MTDDCRLSTDDCQSFLEDAAHYPGGHAAGVVFPRTTRARNGRFELETKRGRIAVPVPTYTRPQVAKRSVGSKQYNLPGSPDVSAVHRKSGWQSAVVVAGPMLAGVALAFRQGTNLD